MPAKKADEQEDRAPHRKRSPEPEAGARVGSKTDPDAVRNADRKTTNKTVPAKKNAA